MRRLLAGIGVAGALALLAAPAASAAREIGDRCVANASTPDATAIVLNNGLSSLELPIGAPPEPQSVITRWKVNVPADYGKNPVQLVTFKQSGEFELQQVSESAIETSVGGAANEWATRIPIPEYGRIGLRIATGAMLCIEQPGHIAGLVAGGWANGESRPNRIVEPSVGVPLIAMLEPDRDGDGYGDESQDACSASAALQTPCPVVHLVPKVTVFRRGIGLEVSTGDPARVEVTGQVGWGYRPRGGGPSKRLIVGLPGGTQEVAKKATVGFWLPLPSRVIGRLEKLSVKKKLKAHLTVVATDAIGHQTPRDLTVRLPGWAKPPHGQRPTR